MANLSQDDRDIIAKHPLNNSLDRLQDLLRITEKSYESHLISYDGAVDQTHQKAISKLLYALQGEETAFNLLSKTSSRNVASELSFLFGRIQNGDFDYKHYKHYHNWSSERHQISTSGMQSSISLSISLD
jgi:hypothetical protein